LTDVMAVQTQLMQMITQMLAQNNNNNHRGRQCWGVTENSNKTPEHKRRM
jgi:hypothetical protein